MKDRNESNNNEQANAQVQNEPRTGAESTEGGRTIFGLGPIPNKHTVMAALTLTFAMVVRFGERLEAHYELTVERVRAVPSYQRVGVMTATLMLLVAVHPVAAQSEFCDSAFGELVLALEGLGVGIGTAVLGFMLLIGVAMMVLTPIFPGQSAVGLVLVFMVLAAGILMVFGLAFLGLIFDVAGVSGESCSTLVD